MSRLIPATLFLALTAPLSAQQPMMGAPGGPATPMITTSATGEARTTPDRATIQIGVQSRAVTAAAASNENARRQRAVIDTIKALGIPAAQISTAQYTVNPEMRYDPQGQQPPRLTGYVVSNVVQVEIRRTEQIGPVLDAALAKGANQINSLDFWSSNTQTARQAALTDAVSRARAEAETIARAAGGSLGELVRISSSETPVVPVPRRMMATAAMEKAPTPIEAGEETVTAAVTASWRFVPGPR